MGICFSTKKSPPPPSPPPPPPDRPPPPLGTSSSPPPLPPPLLSPTTVPEQTTNPSEPPQPQSSKSEDTHTKKPIFLITPSKTNKQPTTTDPHPLLLNIEDPAPAPAAMATPFRTSSCTKEEVESILIQCGRLSRSSSGNVDGHNRRYSGSKRSFDFDGDKKEGEDLERSLLTSSARPSPCRRALSRERDGGGRRVSRSPGKRSDQQSGSSGARQQPGKMVSVPAREKVQRNTGNATARTASPRSRSPGMVRVGNENGHPPGAPCLSRSSSRKAEHSPYRRTPMAEIDGNCTKVEPAGGTGSGGESLKKKGALHSVPQQQRAKTEQKIQITMTSRSKEEHQEQEIKEETQTIEPKPVITRSRSSRRSSHDLDVLLGNMPAASYASLLLEDINNYHQQNTSTTTSFPLPACLSKAQSILEAVADLNHDSFSSNGQLISRGSTQKPSFLGPDVLEQSLHKFVSVRSKTVVLDDAEPQESAGSNSFAEQQWGAINCETGAGDSSSERCWASSCSGREVDEERGNGSRCSGAARRKELERGRRIRRGMGDGGGRACSAPAGAGAASSS